MPDITFDMMYEFSYTVNDRSVNELRKAELRAKSCEQIYLERMFFNLPEFFNRDYASTKDYFLAGYPWATPSMIEENNLKPDHNVKTIISCVAKHFCSVMFPSSVMIDGYTGTDEDYGFETNFRDALEQMSLLTAAERWLDLWASWFGIFRFNGESDTSLRNRIAEVLNQPKNTITVIKRVLSVYLGYEPKVYELAATGIHNPPDSPPAPAPVNSEFAHNALKDILRRGARIVVELKRSDPIDGSCYVSFPSTDPPLTEPPLTPDLSTALSGDEWFVTDPVTSTHPLIDGDPVTRREAYVTKDFEVNTGGVSLANLIGAVTLVKPGGIKVYYESDGQYLVV